MPCWAMDATYLMAHRTALNLWVKKGEARQI